ncbi:hypothetical protein BS78_03G061800 [Paspalum vaginatum]|nr:hypothetical protein BS78_03G061800 [Paspalum vaginatum]
MATAAVPVLRLKLLVDTKSQRVLLAEAGKDAVDFRFSLLALPLATAVALIGSSSVPGSVGSLYASVERLDGSYVPPGADKAALLRPTVFCGSPAATAASSLLLPADTCPNCHHPMETALEYRPAVAVVGRVVQLQSLQREGRAFARGAAKGFVKGVVTYMLEIGVGFVTDDLIVTPMSAISSITLLNAFAVTDLAALQETTVQLGYHEGVLILKASLQSKTVLTDVFLRGKRGSARASSSAPHG